MGSKIEKEYLIINKTAIQKRIEELEYLRKHSSSDNNDYYQGQIKALNEILSQSTPLIPEVEKAFEEGFDKCLEDNTIMNPTDYISNLKLDI